jgi:gas vesicle protein
MNPEEIQRQQIIREAIQVYKQVIEKLKESETKNLKGVSPRLAVQLGIHQTQEKIQTEIQKIMDQIQALESKL